MAYDRQFLSVDFLSDIPGTEEIAVTGLNFSVIPGWTGAAAALAEIDLDDTLGSELASDYLAIDAVSGFLRANYSRFYAIKVAAIGVDGLYLADPKIYELPSPSTGASTGIVPQCTVVLSMWSGSHIGKANYGRMYYPHSMLTLASSAPFTDATLTDLVAAAGALMVDNMAGSINAQITDTVQAFIMSNSAPAPSKPVTAVRVGRVNDTQRRRRNRLTEQYSVATV